MSVADFLRAHAPDARTRQANPLSDATLAAIADLRRAHKRAVNLLINDPARDDWFEGGSDFVHADGVRRISLQLLPGRVADES